MADPVQAARLPALSSADIAAACRRGEKWIIVDNTVLDVSSLLAEDNTAHKGGDVFSIGRDNTHLFRELHANLPPMMSKHRPDLPSITDHIREKVQLTAVGVLASRRGEVPLTDPAHAFWRPTDRKPPYLEAVGSSIAAAGKEATELVAAAVTGLTVGSVEWRAFWAVVGVLVADAAAQPTHWNYKVTYYHEALKNLGRWDSPEFLRPSLNAYYHVPLGSHSCFGDQAAVVLRSLVRAGGLDLEDLIRAHVDKFGPRGEYGPLGRHDGAAAGDLPISGPWRHGSIATFLQNVARGAKWPQCGSNDGSSDCFVKIVPVVALYAGHKQLLSEVAKVVRVTQNNQWTVGYACAAARVLEQIILNGVEGEEAIRIAAEDLLSVNERGMEGHIGQELADILDLKDMPYLQGVLTFCGGRYNAVTVS